MFSDRQAEHSPHAQMGAASINEAVTVIIRRNVKATKVADYEDWLRRFQAEAQKSLDGYLGATTQRPTGGSSYEYVSVLRFTSMAPLQAFEASELRARYLAEATPYVEGDAIWEKLTGLEFWFSAPSGTKVPQPSRFRMALVMIAVVFFLVLSIGSAVGFVLADWPSPLRLLVTISIEVFFMTYWLMPRLTRWLAPWIYPSKVS